jgi:Bacterial mobilisation protein (MobC)
MRSAKENKMGRPKIIEPRNQQLNLSFTISEFADIRQRAYLLGMRPAHFARAALLRSHTALVSQGAGNSVSRLIHDQLKRLGNNLNQMVRHLHQTGDPLPPDLEPLLKDIRDLIAKVDP